MNPCATRSGPTAPGPAPAVRPCLEPLEVRDQPSTIFGAGLNAVAQQAFLDMANQAVLVQQTQQDILAAVTNTNPSAQGYLNAVVRNDLFHEGLGQLNLQHDLSVFQLQSTALTALGLLDLDDQVDTFFNALGLVGQMDQLAPGHQLNFFAASSGGLM